MLSKFQPQNIKTKRNQVYQIFPYYFVVFVVSTQCS